MTKIPHWFKCAENQLALIIVTILLILHLIIINVPNEFIIDEAHYVPEANSIIAGDGLLHPEHPTLGKLLIAAGIVIFGDNAFGWRIFSVLFGVTSILLFYLVCRKLTKNKYVPVLATYIFAFENFNFVQTGSAMLDVFFVTLMIASFLMYLNNRYVLAGIMLALSATAKMTGGLGVIVIIIHWIVTRRKQKFKVVKFLIAAPLAFMVLMPFWDYLATGDLVYPWDSLQYMISTHTTLTFADYSTAGNISRPFEWLLYPKSMLYFWDPMYLGAISWTLWALIVPAFGFAVFGTIKKDKVATFGLIWITSTYLILIPIELITDRIMFVFYFYPTIGAISLMLGLGIQKLWALSTRRSSKRARWGIRAPLIAWMVGHLVVFVIMTPMLLPLNRWPYV